MMPSARLLLAPLLLVLPLPAAAQTAEDPTPRQEEIMPEDAATSAIVKTDDLPVIGDELDENGVGESDIDVIREVPEEEGEEGPPDVPRVLGEQVDLQAPVPRQPARMFPGELAPATEGAIGRGRVYAEDLKDYTVHLADVEGFGKVERLIINLETGAVEDMIVAAGGGLLGIGETRFEIPFDQVAAINTGSKELRVSISRAQITLPGDTGESELRD